MKRKLHCEASFFYVMLSYMKTHVYKNPDEMAKEAATYIAEFIARNNDLGKPTVLGLATGETPKPLYAELIRLHKNECLDFSKVITFNLDEYLGLPANSADSYSAYMHRELFKHVNIDKNNIHLLKGDVREKDIDAHCADYEREIKDAGGIDIQILGIGGEGHIGFNEKGSEEESFSVNSRTRKVTLSEQTLQDNNPPSDYALSMGVGTILEAKEIVLLANGTSKAPVMQEMLKGNSSNVSALPARALYSHDNCTVMLDKAAAGQFATHEVASPDTAFFGSSQGIRAPKNSPER